MFPLRCEVLRVLLLLLIEPTPQNISPNLTTVLEKYTWDSEDTLAKEETSKILTEEKFTLLQSMVMAVEMKDVKGFAGVGGSVVFFAGGASADFAEKIGSRETREGEWVLNVI